MSDLDDFIKFLTDHKNIDTQFIHLVRTWVSTYKTEKMLNEYRRTE